MTTQTNEYSLKDGENDNTPEQEGNDKDLCNHLFRKIE